MSSSALGKIYETVLSIPGMNESVKTDLRLSRRHIFFLTKVIERGLAKNPDKDGHSVLELLPEGMSADLAALVVDLLNKAGLAEMCERLKGL